MYAIFIMDKYLNRRIQRKRTSATIDEYTSNPLQESVLVQPVNRDKYPPGSSIKIYIMAKSKMESVP